MKKILFLAMALGVFASCSKERETYLPQKGDSDVYVSFVGEPNTYENRAFFDPAATTEV